MAGDTISLSDWSWYTGAVQPPASGIDPDGMDYQAYGSTWTSYGAGDGDYYDQQANKIGTDGKNDNKNYVVQNTKDVKDLKNTTGPVPLSKVSSAVELPSNSVRTDMGAAVNRSNNSSIEANDPEGGMHEEGGMYGTDNNGNQVAVNAPPGQVYKQGQSGVGVTPTDVDVQGQGAGTANLNNAVQASGLNVQGTFHVHPMGDASTSFKQPPSGADLNNAVYRSNNMGISGNNYVLAAGNNTVYIYKNVNGTGQVIATFPLNKFLQLK